MIATMGELLDALDDIAYPPFEMAVLDAHGRVGIVYADEDAVLGIQRLAYEDEPNNPVLIVESDFPMTRLVPQPADPSPRPCGCAHSHYDGVCPESGDPS